ncbi:MAG: hypothetical protein LBO74_04665 [Candidatus Symbiothrix sp.]|jgi:hypothetical protein|nr:hypothetical protein [Candidatus Symbiothrix sp.]
MKKYIFIAIIALTYFSCRKDVCYIPENEILIKKNYTEQLVFLDIESNILSKEEFYQSSSADTTKMQRLDEQKTQQLLDIFEDVWNASFPKETNGVSMESVFIPINEDTVYQKVFICGRIDVHPDLTSLVIFRSDSITGYAGKGYHLLNLKGNELKSAVRLSTSFYMADDNILEGTTYHNGLFTYLGGPRIISQSDKRYFFIKSLLYKNFVGYARYQIDKNGFIQTIDN